jgi:histidinol phosphatase-like enzyme (inositol monophosphatase family)
LEFLLSLAIMDRSPIHDRLHLALAASARAEALVMRYFLDASLQVDLKSDLSPVTAADRDAEELLRSEISQVFPDDGILGEEFGESGGQNEFRWILDPIDGTKSFVYGVPLFGMLIGLQFRGENVAGICRLPALAEVIFAWRGGGAWRQHGSASPRRIAVSQRSSLRDALFCYTAAEGFAAVGRFDVLTRLSAECATSRGWGDCYGHMLVASGRADLMIDPLLTEWDAAALIPIVEEAGGVFMDWTGSSTATGGNGISTIPSLREDVLKIIQRQA